MTDFYHIIMIIYGCKYGRSDFVIHIDRVNKYHDHVIINSIIYRSDKIIDTVATVRDYNVLEFAHNLVEGKYVNPTKVDTLYWIMYGTTEQVLQQMHGMMIPYLVFGGIMGLNFKVFDLLDKYFGRESWIKNISTLGDKAIQQKILDRNW